MKRLLIFAPLIMIMAFSFNNAQEQSPFSPQYQYAQIPLPIGGLNTSLTGRLDPTEASVLRDLMIRNRELRFVHCHRELFDRPTSFTDDGGVNFVGGYRSAGGGLQLLAQSSGHLYALDVNQDSLRPSDALVDTSYKTLSLSSLGTVTGTSGSKRLDLDSTGRWKSIFSGGNNLAIYIDSAGTGTWSEYAVDYFLDDSTVFLTGNLGYSPSSDTFFLSGGVGEIVFGRTFVDSFWMLTKSGIYSYGQQLNDVMTDTAYYKFVETYHQLYSTAQSGEICERWYLPAAGDGGTGTAGKLAGDIANGGHWYLFIDRGNVGSDASCLDSVQDNVYYTMYPINRTVSAGRVVETFSSFVTSENDSTAYVSFHKLIIDHSSYRTMRADVVLDTAYTYSGTPVKCIKIVCDTCSFAATDFQSGDWFVSPGDTVLDTGSVWRMNVIGGIVSGDTVYANAGVFTASVADTQITFYRRVKRVRDVGGYNVGCFWRNRLCSVHDTSSSQIDFSDAYDPSTFSEYFARVSPDDGEKIMWLREMYGNLIIGKQSSIWKLNGVPSLDNYAALEKVWEGASFISEPTIVNHDNLLFGLARDGFYVFDFNSMVRISDNIEKYFSDSLNWEYIGNARAGYWDDHYWCSLPAAGYTRNTITLMYNPRVQAWSTSGTPFSGIHIDHANIASDSDQVYFGDTKQTKIVVYGRGTSNEQPEWTTGWIDLGDPWDDKIINRVFISCDVATVLNGLYCFLYTDNGTSFEEYSVTDAPSTQGSRKVYKFQFPGDKTRGYEHKFRFYCPVSTIWARIGEVWIEYYTESVDY